MENTKEKIQVNSWKEFKNNYYEKKPAVFSEFMNINKLFNLESLFSSMKEAINSYENNKERNFSMWVNGKLNTNPIETGPCERDLSLLGYIKRMTTNEKEFTFSLNNIQKYDPILWVKAMNFVDEFIKDVGIPSDEVDIDTFLGKYSSTPRGIHTDQASTLMTVLHGKKTMLLWPPDFFESRVKTNSIRGTTLRKTLVGEYDVKEFIEQAIVLEGNKGETLYWPAGYWHTSYSTAPETNIVMNLGFFYQEMNNSLLNQFNGLVINSIAKDSNLIKHHYVNNEQLPVQEIENLNKFREILNKKNIEFSYKEFILKYSSSAGFKSHPLETNLIFNPIKQYQIVSNLKIGCLEQSKRLNVYIHGRKKVYPNSAELKVHINSINIDRKLCPFNEKFTDFYNDLLNCGYISEMN